MDLDGMDGGCHGGGHDGGHGLDHGHGEGGLDGGDFDGDYAEAEAVDTAFDLGLGHPERDVRRSANSDAIKDNLLLSYDHCDVFNGGQQCVGSGYNLVDPVKGTFDDDTFDPNGSVRADHKHHLSPAEVELVKRLADDPRRRMFGIHVINHGAVDLQEEFRKVAERLGLVRIDQVTPNFFAAADFHTQISDWNYWGPPPYTRKRLPAGYYPNCTGWTRTWKQYWQIDHRKGGFWDWLLADLDRPKHDPKWAFDRYCKTVLEVTSVNWYYHEAADFETRFHIKVISMPLYDQRDGRWGYLKKPFEQHQKMARTIAEHMMRRMKECPPAPHAVIFRGDILKRLRDEALRRRAVSQQVIAAPALDLSGVASGVCCGADIYAALGSVKPTTRTATIFVPKRRQQ